MGNALILNLPLKILLGFKRKKNEKGNKVPNHFYINLNAYRNADFFTLNNAKIKFKELIEDQLRSLPSYDWAILEYVLYPATKRDMDVSNICSIADKFFSDAFVEAGKIEDDNFNFIPSVRYSFGAVDKNNPRVEVHISGQIKEDQMQLQAILNHDDFEAALEAYVRSNFPIPEGTKPEIAITAGRGDKGYSAVVTFATTGDTNQKASPAEAVMQAALKEEGSKMNRLGSDVMPKASAPVAASKRAVVEDTPAPAPVEEAKAEATASLFQPEAVEDAEVIEEAPADRDEAPFALSDTQEEASAEAGEVKPLFSFG